MKPRVNCPENLKREVCGASYGIPGRYHDGLDVGYGVDVFEGECSWLVQSSSLTSHSDLVGIGTEAKALGFHVQLGPVGGPLGKIAEAGWDVQLRRFLK
jgi:hypothetical protein